MTPAIDTAKKTKIKFRVHQYVHDPASRSYGEEAAEKLGILPGRVFKTLVAELDSRNLAVSVIPVDRQLNLKAFAKALGAKKAKMADKKDVERSTGYVLGGVSPIGQKKRLPTRIDQSAEQFETIFISAGRRGLEIELAPQDLAELTGGKFEIIGK